MACFEKFEIDLLSVVISIYLDEVEMLDDVESEDDVDDELEVDTLKLVVAKIVVGN